MPAVTERHIDCPYCGEIISVLVDDSVPQQQYVEDCEVCCRPIVLEVTVTTDLDVQVCAHRENE